jgi:predicted outer membrane repeat protein
LERKVVFEPFLKEQKKFARNRSEDKGGALYVHERYSDERKEKSK